VRDSSARDSVRAELCDPLRVVLAGMDTASAEYMTLAHRVAGVCKLPPPPPPRPDPHPAPPEVCARHAERLAALDPLSPQYVAESAVFARRCPEEPAEE
jgi:hypothetical protein